MKLPSCSCFSGSPSCIRPGRSRSPWCISRGPAWKWYACSLDSVNCWRRGDSCESGTSTYGVSRTWCQFLLQIPLHTRPFRIENAEVDTVAEAAAPHDHMLPQRAFLRHADPADRVAGTLIQGVRLELDSNAPESLECVTQHQVLGLRIDRSAPPGSSNPG